MSTVSLVDPMCQFLDLEVNEGGVCMERLSNIPESISFKFYALVVPRGAQVET